MHKTKIMVIDDDLDFLEETKKMLASSGYDTVVFSDPVYALTRVKKTKPDIILLDLKMEGKTGFQVAHELKLAPETAGIPIIAMTAYYNEKDNAELLGIYGIKTRLLKPFNPADLISQIENAINGKKGVLNT
jgi:CheY-like chemotaxis protein